MWQATYSDGYGVDAVTDYTGYLLRAAFMRASAVVARRFEPGSHPRDAGVLIALEAEGPASPQELAQRLNVNRAGMGQLIDSLEGPGSQQELAQRLTVNGTVRVKLIDSLEARGYVPRPRTPDDRRAYALHPTPAGREALAEMLPRMRTAEAELAEPLSGAEGDRL